jgi:hypothetical protein
VKPGTPGVPEPGNEKARKGRKTETGNQFMGLGNPKRRRPALVLTGEGMPGAHGPATFPFFEFVGLFSLLFPASLLAGRSGSR